MQQHCWQQVNDRFLSIFLQLCCCRNGDNTQKQLCIYIHHVYCTHRRIRNGLFTPINSENVEFCKGETFYRNFH